MVLPSKKKISIRHLKNSLATACRISFLSLCHVSQEQGKFLARLFAPSFSYIAKRFRSKGLGLIKFLLGSLSLDYIIISAQKAQSEIL